MKMKKILSSALVIVMLLTSVMALIPVKSLADSGNASSPTVSIETENILTKTEDIRDLVVNSETGFLKYNYTAREALEYEKGQGYLDSVDYGHTKIYVNRYTGLFYYENTVTGEIFTSNPTSPNYSGISIDDENGSKGTLSQIELTYSNRNDISEANRIYNSLQWILEGSALEVSQYNENGVVGLKVHYHLGEKVDFFAAPGAFLAEDFENDILTPMANTFAEMLQSAINEDFDADFASAQYIQIGRGKPITSYNITEIEDNHYERLDTGDLTDNYDIGNLKKSIDGLVSYAAIKLGTTSVDYARISAYAKNMQEVLTQYVVQIPDEWKYLNMEKYEKLCKTSTVFAEGKSIYLFSNYTLNNVRLVNTAMTTLFYGDNKFEKEDIEAFEFAAGFTADGFSTASFKCDLVYAVDANGELLVSIPSNSIEYDTTEYMLTSIIPLKYFSAGDMSKDGYIFFPDGSGTIVDYSDFYFASSTGLNSVTLTVKSKVYGQDFCYTNIEGKHLQQITVPVYGMVNTNTDNNKTGFFAIIEEGSSIATLGFGSGGQSHKFSFAYSSFEIHPSDSFDLNESFSVSGLKTYTVATSELYRGQIKIRYAPLMDSAVAENKGITKFNEASYVGMANYYREYLKSNGVINGYVNAAKQLPLYIEAFGSIDVTKKILTFPVTVSEPLTSFEDVATMYDELTDAVNVLKNKAAKLREEAAGLAAKEVERKATLEAQAKEYDALAAKVVNIKNVNFRLTGFANGGMYFTYPSKAKWESKVGGKRGFEALLEKSAAISTGAEATANLGVYPDFDFMYINNTAMFDGVSNNRDAARMIDNRYASKQVYNSISSEFESLFALLVNTDSLNKLYEKFNKKYSKYFEDFDTRTLSVSTLGSDLNSNFDVDNFIDREKALGNVSALLSDMAESYSLMTDKGNIYSVEYVDHILNMAVDSSHFRHSSYTVPFLGMVLHGYVSYTGVPINYSGSPEYDILRSIENGASLYYILCYQSENLSYLKEDENLSKYYGIDYKNWFDSVVEQYAIVNSAIGSLQDYIISNHEILIAERVVYGEELNKNYEELALEYIEAANECIKATVDKALKENSVGAQEMNLMIDKDSILTEIAELMDTDVNGITETVKAALNKVIAEYETYYKNENGTVSVAFDASMVSYESIYSYKTDSLATDSEEAYVYTDYTCDNGNVVIVTYTKYDASGNAVDSVQFILNYNTYAVDVRLDAASAPIRIEAYGFK